MKLKMGTLTPPQYQHLQKHGWVQVEDAFEFADGVQNVGTGYVGFQPASTPRAARARRAGKLAAQTNAKVKFGGK